MFFFKPLVFSAFVISVTGVILPRLTCTVEKDCHSHGWIDPYPKCVNNQCQCDNGQCIIYTTSGVNYRFYCGSCGVLGSECNETNRCTQLPAYCGDDKFCHCDKGDVFLELCLIYVPSPTTLRSVVLIVVLVSLLLILRIIKSWEKIKHCLCRQRCSDTDSVQSTVVGINPNSGEKTAAYTITNSSFMVTSHDSDLEWGLEFSRQLAVIASSMQQEDEQSSSSSPSSSSSTLRSHVSSSTRRRIQFNSSSRPPESISEPGPSGWEHDSRPDRRSSTSSAATSFMLSSTPQRSSTRSSNSSTFPSRDSTLTRRYSTSSISRSLTPSTGSGESSTSIRTSTLVRQCRDSNSSRSRAPSTVSTCSFYSVASDSSVGTVLSRMPSTTTSATTERESLDDRSLSSISYTQSMRSSTRSTRHSLSSPPSSNQSSLFLDPPTGAVSSFSSKVLPSFTLGFEPVGKSKGIQSVNSEHICLSRLDCISGSGLSNASLDIEENEFEDSSHL